ncbi:regulatory protein RecX [Marinomonas algicola]|uniref:regulatory protein RecX n=1 Tax=Marinomonas algicola TaxID=2773454 RepID=UPI00174A5C59|nr:regulatory protein RecX [Marinomonas algicola]
MANKALNALYDTALRKLSYREHCTKDLKTKLFKYTDEPELIEEVITLLKESNYLNDKRFAEIYVRSKFTKGIGEIRVRQELKMKNIQQDDIANALNQPEIDWFELAVKVKTKKQPDHQSLSFSDTAKLRRFLQSRGFTFDQIQYALMNE